DSKTVDRERTIFHDKKAEKRNENALLLQIIKNPSANTVSVIDGIMKRIPKIEQNSGNRVHLNVIREDAGFIRDSVNDTLGNLIMGIVLTALVLMVFLHDWRSTIIISVAMPLSIISTFLVMQYLGISINVLSLMGLSCAVGTLVASSVIVLENIFRHRASGMSAAEAASIGTREVLIAVIGATATNVAVFVPLGGMEGPMGKILSSFAFTVAISTVFSLIVSVTVTPLLASRLLSAKIKQPGQLGQKLDALFKKLEELYGKSIAFFVAQKKRSIAFIAAVFIAFVLSIMGFSLIEMEMVPKSDGGRIQVSVELPQGSSLDMTALLLVEIEKRLAAYSEVKSILTTLGNAGSLNRDVSVALMEISLVPKKQRRISNDGMAAAMTRTLSNIPGAVIKVSAPSEIVIAEGAPIDLYLKGTDSAILSDLGNKLRNRIATVPGISNAAINTKAGKQELVFEPNRKQILQDGLTVQTVAMSLRFAIDGVVSTTYREGGAEYDIRVKMSNNSLQDIQDIRNIPIVTNSGIFPLSRYADVYFENGYNMIMRVDKLQAIEFTADILPGYTQSGVLSEVMKATEEIDLPAGYTISQAGLSDSMSESVVSMGIVFITAILLMYILLAILLENAVQPLYILTSVPLSIIGVTAACLLTNTVLNTIAMIGIVMLIGIVTNNSILLLDHYNRLKQNGMNMQDALIHACPAKLKAIVMSNIAVIMGIIPMALGIGASLAEMRQPMGVVIFGGIISSMIMTLWLIPCLEVVLNKKNKGESK
ncbi:MAG: efflux RND transporter permease subunit, partial [Spirochaetaceae bacterium]|nr:efflux RND transporter permease subunit [Spirochaetaceae bacterium]